jgi:glycosyltransferase involved in cell wall biosynthesis
MQEPLVSIILPVYNGARFLSESIRSCLDQTYQNWELIIVDDASTDETSIIIQQFAATDSRIKTLRHERNFRQPTAVNNGFAIAQGKYLTWTSDDNIYRSYAIQRMVEALERERPEVGFIYANYMSIDENCIEQGLIEAKEAVSLLQENAIGPCFLYRRAVYEKVGNYGTKYPLVLDYDYWLRLSLHFEFKHIDEDLYLYRYHSNSITGRYLDEMQRQASYVLAMYLPYIRWADPRTLRKACLRLSKHFRKEGDRRSALRLSLWSAIYLPAILLHRLAHS